jgi:hypothetical protein
MKQLRATTIALSVLNLGLAVAVVLAWTRGQERVAQPATLVAPPLDMPDLSVSNSIPMPSVDVATIRSQSVFYASRSYYEPPPAPTEVAPPEYEMSGTLRLADGKRIGFVKNKADRSSRTLHVGDDLDSWHVQVIEQDRIVLDRNQQIAELHTSTGGGVSGLIRGSASAPRTALSGIRVLEATRSGVTQPGSQAPSLEARTFRPPGPVGK